MDTLANTEGDGHQDWPRKTRDTHDGCDSIPIVCWVFVHADEANKHQDD